MKTFPSYKNKNVLILGLGLLGRGLKDAIFFAQQKANVVVTDLKTAKQLKNSVDQLKKYKNIKLVLGQHRKQDINQADLIIRNAGVPLKSQYLQHAFKQNKKIEMDESLFAQYCPCPIIGVTGTRGKTTTATLIYELLKKTSKKVYLAGNIQGTATLPLIKKVTKNDLVVLELSSWQLQGFGWNKISPHIAIFTNIFPDHLNRYKGMKDYIADKKLIYQNQTKNDFLIINQDNLATKKLAAEAKSKTMLFSAADVPKNWQLNILGQHNLENIAAAIKVAKIFKIKTPTIKKVIENFRGVEHRLELVKTIKGINFINDTTSTTPVAGQKALAAVDKPIILIAGGAQKNLDLTDFAKDIVKKVKAVILLSGTATPDLKNKIIKFKGQDKIQGEFLNFKAAIKKAYSLADTSDTVLLSPGCSSFGLFINEFDRGEQFKRIVKNLK